jgi:hypothetical protein
MMAGSEGTLYFVGNAALPEAYKGVYGQNNVYFSSKSPCKT